jgi:hypothetical protein
LGNDPDSMNYNKNGNCYKNKKIVGRNEKWTNGNIMGVEV